MKKMFWIDLEMTGLDENVDKILEIAVIITDLNLNELEAYHRIIFQPLEVLDSMNDWCKNTHSKSGLTRLVPGGAMIAAVEKDLIDLVSRHYPDKEERVVLCGNSVNNDKRFVDKYFVEFAKRLHYRLIDVSSFKEIFRSKYGIKFEKLEVHRADGDIRESIKELGCYLGYINVASEVKNT